MQIVKRTRCINGYGELFSMCGIHVEYNSGRASRTSCIWVNEKRFILLSPLCINILSNVEDFNIFANVSFQFKTMVYDTLRYIVSAN